MRNYTLALPRTYGACLWALWEPFIWHFDVKAWAAGRTLLLIQSLLIISLFLFCYSVSFSQCCNEKQFLLSSCTSKLYYSCICTERLFDLPWNPSVIKFIFFLSLLVLFVIPSVKFLFFQTQNLLPFLKSTAQLQKGGCLWIIASNKWAVEGPLAQPLPSANSVPVISKIARRDLAMEQMGPSSPSCKWEFGMDPQLSSLPGCSW